MAGVACLWKVRKPAASQRGKAPTGDMLIRLENPSDDAIPLQDAFALAFGTPEGREELRTWDGKGGKGEGGGERR